MQIVINDTIKEVPFCLSAIKLGDFIEFQNKYGKELDSRAEYINSLQYSNEGEKEIDTEKLTDDRAFAWYSYFTGFNLFEVRDETFTQPVLSQFRMLETLMQSEDELVKDYSAEIEFNNEIWMIQDYKDCSFEEMNLKQLKLFRQIMLYLYHLKKGRYEYLLPLCAIFFRKKDEPFTNELLEGERIEILKELPMSIEKSTLNFLHHTYAYSKRDL